MEREILINQIAIMKALMSMRPAHNAYMMLQERMHVTENLLRDEGPIRLKEDKKKGSNETMCLDCGGIGRVSYSNSALCPTCGGTGKA